MHNVTLSVTIVTMNLQAEASPRAPQLADWALSQGITALTTLQIANLLSIPADQVRRRLHAPMKRSEWVTPTRGLWIPVAPEYRTWGAPPGIEIVDQIMLHRGINYYVGWLSAAALLGASHQAPQEFQVAVDRQIRNRGLGRTRFVFVQRELNDLPTWSHLTRTGYARVSTAELTLLDVAADIERVGGIDNAATVILELVENNEIDWVTLAKLSERYPASAARRVGFLIEQLGNQVESELEPLRLRAKDAAATASILDPLSVARGPLDSSWMIRVNSEVQEET